MEKIKFNIIMPCYNSASHNYFIDAIDSVISQEYQNWELLAVNDGSTDKTFDILSSYAEKDPRIKVFSKENGGYSSAINMGLDHLSGDYFMMMGSDDYLFPCLLKTIAEEMGNDYPDLIAFRTIKYMDGVSKGIDINTDFSTKAFLYNSLVTEYVEKYPEHANIFFIRDTSKFYKVSLLGDLHLYGKYGYDADGIFAILFAHKARSFMSIPVDGYRWTIRSDSVSATSNVPKNLDRLCNWKQFFEANKSLKPNEVTMYDVRYAKYFVNIAQETALTIHASDSQNIKIFRRTVGCIPGILKRYSIRLNIKKRVYLFLLIKVPRVWRFAIEKRIIPAKHYF